MAKRKKDKQRYKKERVAYVRQFTASYLLSTICNRLITASSTECHVGVPTEC